MTARLRFAYVGPTARRDSLMWLDGELIPPTDEKGRRAAYDASMRPGGHRVTVGGTNYLADGSSLTVDAALPGTDVHGRPLRCRIVFDGIPRNGRAKLPTDELRRVLDGHGYRLDDTGLQAKLRVGGALRAVRTRGVPLAAVALTLAITGRLYRRRLRAIERPG